MVSSEECSLRLILSEHLRSGRRLFHFCYHEVHQRDWASKPHHRVGRLSPGQAHSLLHHLLDPRPILHVLLGRSPLQRRRLFFILPRIWLINSHVFYGFPVASKNLLLKYFYLLYHNPQITDKSLGVTNTTTTIRGRKGLPFEGRRLTLKFQEKCGI